LFNSSLGYFDVNKINSRCTAVCSQWDVLAQLTQQRKDELEVQDLIQQLYYKFNYKCWIIVLGRLIVVNQVLITGEYLTDIPISIVNWQFTAQNVGSRMWTKIIDL